MSSPSAFTPPSSAFWVFAYGSLMWNPDFPFTEQHHATLYGYHRALCVYSWVYRGTEANPGLVFGLDHGGAVQGIAFRIAAKNAASVYAKIFEREMITNVYKPHWASCRLAGNHDQPTRALAFVANRANKQYAGRLSEAETLRLIRAGHGTAGPCTEYVTNTACHLRDIGIRDHTLERLARQLAP